VKAIMAHMGYAVMGTATANGARRAIEAAQKAIASPLLEAGAIDGARGILINITGSASLKLAEVQEACSIIQSAADDDANIIFGAVLDEKMKDSVKITVIATGFRDADYSHGRRAEVSTGFVVSREPVSRPTFSRETKSNDDFFRRDEPEFESDPEPTPPPMVMEEVAPVMESEPPSPVLALDSMRDASMRDAMIANFEQSDLDVPAFLRKRNETM
jgi:cell division protein FtsZ